MISMILTQKIRIYPNSTTRKQLESWFGYSRYSYNQGLDTWNKLYSSGEKPTERTVRDYYKRNLKNDWERELPPNILDNSIKHLADGYKMFFKGYNSRPKFKKKGKSIQSFSMNRKADSTIRIISNKVYLPKIKYGMRLAEKIKIDGVIKYCTVTKRASKYFISLNIECSSADYFKIEGDSSVGIDANIGHFDISSETNSRYDTLLLSLKPLYEQIAFYQKRMSRKSYNSNKYLKLKTKIQGIYMRIQNIQDDWLHKFTTMIVSNYKTICIEDLNVKGMLSNNKISRSISRSLFYRFRLQLTYKSILYGNNLIIADRWFPSTQLCSFCGFRKEGTDKMKLSDRTYKCDNCGEIMDRDTNSAYNLKMYGKSRVG